MPTITFEVDPNCRADRTSNYSSLVFMPDELRRPTSGAATSTRAHDRPWGVTGSAVNGTDCGINGWRCTFAELQAPRATTANGQIISVAVGKGSDYAFQGAVDGLRVNDTVFDFEAGGVFDAPPSTAPGAAVRAAPGTLFGKRWKQGGWEDRPAEIAPRTGADPSNLWGNARGGSEW